MIFAERIPYLHFSPDGRNTTTEMSTDHNVAIITGASSGIGKETATRLADDGYTVVLAARRVSKLRELANEIENNGGNAEVHPIDVTKQDEIDNLVATTVETHGVIDVLVNNAGILSTDRVVDADPDDWRQMVEVNLLGVMNLTRTVVPHMLDRGDGHVVVVSSVNAHLSSPSGSGYCATKAGVNGFADSLRKEVSDEGVRVTVIEPGMVETEMHNEETKVSVPMLDPEAIADGVTYAVSQPKSVSVNQLRVRPTNQLS